MPKLDKTYVYYDNRKTKTHFAIASFQELEVAYTHLTSGSSMRLYLYLLHKISGRTPYDRHNEPRMGFYLGIEQIEKAIGISRASIYRGFAELVKLGLLEKHAFKMSDTKNVIVALSIPIKTETETTKTEPTTNHAGSQNCDPQDQQNHVPKGNSRQLCDLKNDTINLEPTRSNYPSYLPKEKNKKIEKGNLENSFFAFKSPERKEEIMSIVSALENHGYLRIDKDREFSNIIQWIRSSTNLSRRKRDINKAIQIHNERQQARTYMVNTSKDGSTEKGGNLTGGEISENAKNEEQINNLEYLISGDYNSYVHDNLLDQSSFIWKLPEEIQNIYIPKIKKLIAQGERKRLELQRIQQEEQEKFDRLIVKPEHVELDNKTITSQKYSELHKNLINQFKLIKDTDNE
jgi:hypothetical protein